MSEDSESSYLIANVVLSQSTILQHAYNNYLPRNYENSSNKWPHPILTMPGHHLESYLETEVVTVNKGTSKQHLQLLQY